MNPRSPHRAAAAPKLRERLRGAAREAILEAAEAAFVEHGVDVRMETIAEQAGVAVGTLYNHFASRSELLTALAAERRGQLLSALTGALESGAGRPFAERLDAALRALVQAMEGQLAFRRMLLQADPAVPRSRRAAVERELADTFARLLVEGQRDGVLAEDAAGLQPLFLTALVQAALGVSLQHPARLPLAEVPALVVRQFLDGARRGRRP